MRRAAPIVFAAMLLASGLLAAERRSWNKIRYAGGTIPIQASSYDWNTTLTVNLKPEMVAVTIAPARLFASRQSFEIKPTQILSLSVGPAAWRKVGETPEARLPARTPTLFGLLESAGFFGIVYERDGKRGALLLESRFSWDILTVLTNLTGLTVERSQ